MRIAAGVEARRLRGRRGVSEAAGDDGWPVRVAAEHQCFTAGFVPPPHDHGRQRHPGVDLKGPAGPGERAQHGAVLVLESGGIEATRLIRPMPHRVIDVREDGERGRRFGQPQRLVQVGPEEIGGLGPVEEQIHRPGGVQLQRVHRPQNPVEGPGAKHGLDFVFVPVRLTQLGPGQDTQPRKQVPAALHGCQIARGIQGRRAEPAIRPDPGRVPRSYPRRGFGVDDPAGEVGVLGEGDRRQPQRHRVGAGLLHRPVRGVPGPFGVHMSVRRKHQHAFLSFTVLVPASGGKLRWP